MIKETSLGSQRTDHHPWMLLMESTTIGAKKVYQKEATTMIKDTTIGLQRTELITAFMATNQNGLTK